MPGRNEALNRVVFLNRIVSFINHDIEKLIKLSHVNNAFSETLEYYGHEAWQNVKDKLKNEELPLSFVNKVLPNSAWILRCLIMVDYPLLAHSITAEVETIKKLIELGADVNLPKPCETSTPLSKAISLIRPSVVNLLIQNGANLNDAGKMVCQTQVRQYQKQRDLGQIIIRILEKKSDMAISDDTDENASIEFGDEKMLPFAKTGRVVDLYYLELAKKTDDYNKVLDNVKKMKEIKTKTAFGYQAIHIAADRDHMDLMRYLVIDRRDDIDINAQNNSGNTALHHAVCNGNTRIINFLLRNNANVNIRDEEGCTALHWAVSTECYDLTIISLLFNANPENLHVKDKSGKDVLDWAINNEVKRRLIELENSYQESIVSQRSRVRGHR